MATDAHPAAGRGGRADDEVAEARRGRLSDGLAIAWGLAEATVFFVVPDVWISRLALSSRRAAVRGCALALVGALVGGVLLYLAGGRHEAALLALFDRLPAISPGLAAHVRAQLQDLGGLGLLAGGFSGAPYKLYAAQASSAGLGLPMFIVGSVIARGARFPGGGVARPGHCPPGDAAPGRCGGAADLVLRLGRVLRPVLDADAGMRSVVVLAGAASAASLRNGRNAGEKLAAQTAPGRPAVAGRRCGAQASPYSRSLRRSVARWMPSIAAARLWLPSQWLSTSTNSGISSSRSAIS
jgi:membrane protein YqaA with SNARE-associated domain